MWKDDLPPNRATSTKELDLDFSGLGSETWRDGAIKYAQEKYGYVPGYPINPFYLIEGNENKIY